MSSSFSTSANVSPERRRRIRFQLRLALVLLKIGPRHVWTKGRTVNISSNGMLFRCREPVRPGDPIHFIITLLPGRHGEPSLKIRCEGRVVRVEATPNDASDWFIAGATIESWEVFREVNGGSIGK